MDLGRRLLDFFTGAERRRRENQARFEARLRTEERLRDADQRGLTQKVPREDNAARFGVTFSPTNRIHPSR